MSETDLACSLFFFGADSEGVRTERYRPLLELARLGDEIGLHAVWLPERHFQRFGGLYASPSVLGAAVAVSTSRILLRAGSVVLPLQDPIRVAEEWAIVDNLSNGRVGIAVASGWHVNDFVLAPASYARRREDLYEKISLVRRLWRGETVDFPNGEGAPSGTRILPRPIQEDLPIWITATSEASFENAGKHGFNVLTSNFVHDYDPAVFERRVRLYREAIERAHGRRGHVTLMVHTYVAGSENEIDEVARPAMAAYLEASMEMQAVNTVTATDARKGDLSPRQREILTSVSVQKMFRSDFTLVGTVETCRARAATMQAHGADELACLVDFGVPLEAALASVRRIPGVTSR